MCRGSRVSEPDMTVIIGQRLKAFLCGIALKSVAQALENYADYHYERQYSRTDFYADVKLFTVFVFHGCTSEKCNIRQIPDNII